MKLALAVFQSRFGENVQLIKKAIDGGRFGRLILASAQVKWYRSDDYYASAGWRGTWELDGGGVLMNQSIHIIDLLLFHYLASSCFSKNLVALLDSSVISTLFANQSII